MKLQLGCNQKIFKGWTNLDIQDNPGVDIIDDASILSKIDDSSCDIIYACHLLEHFSRRDIPNIISLWYRKLKPGGTLRISVPDFNKVITRYLEYKNIEEVMGCVVGGHRDMFDKHGVIFDNESLSKILIDTGFLNVVKWDWRDVDHGHYDDYSQSYLPHMNKESGLLMSLNIEAKK